MARRFCGVWDDSLVALHVVSDAVIWLAYLWIPLVMLWSYYANRKTLRLRGPLFWILILYTVFITACGWTHFFDALMFYQPAYRINGLVRALTAVASFATAISLVRLVPQAITAPITILTQRVALQQQFEWLRDILDSATEGRLKLCASEAELPPPLPGTPLITEVHAPSDLKQLRKSVAVLMEREGFEGARSYELMTALHEATMNALVHAHGATVTATSSGGQVQLRVEDRGLGIPLDKLPIATLKQGYSTAGSAGQGWFLVLSFVDVAYLLTGTEGTTLVMEMGARPLQRPVPFSHSVGGDIKV